MTKLTEQSELTDEQLIGLAGTGATTVNDADSYPFLLANVLADRLAERNAEVEHIFDTDCQLDWDDRNEIDGGCEICDRIRARLNK